MQGVLRLGYLCPLQIQEQHATPHPEARVPRSYHSQERKIMTGIELYFYCIHIIHIALTYKSIS